MAVPSGGLLWAVQQGLGLSAGDRSKQMYLLRRVQPGVQNGCGRVPHAQPRRVHPLRGLRGHLPPSGHHQDLFSEKTSEKEIGEWEVISGSLFLYQDNDGNEYTEEEASDKISELEEQIEEAEKRSTYRPEYYRGF